MYDNLDLQELRERVDHYKAKHRDIRNHCVVALIGAFVIFFFIWLQADMDFSSSNYRDFLGVWNLSIALLPMVILLIFLLVWLAPRQRLTKERSQRAQKFLSQFLSHEGDSDEADLAESDSQVKEPAKDRVYIVLLVASIIAAGGGASWIIIYLLLSAIPIYLLLKYPLQGLKTESLAAEAKAYFWREIASRVGFALGMLVLNLLIVAGLEQFIRQLQHPFTMDSLLMVTSLIAAFVIELYGFNLWYQQAYFLNPLFDADYDELLGSINNQAKAFGRDRFLFWEAVIRQFKGESAEAEALWREMLDISKDYANIETISIALNNIGYTLVAQDRHEEAFSYFEASIRLNPDLPTLYRGLMGCYSELSIAPERALELGQFMMSITKKPRINVWLAFSEWANRLSAMAVAYANVGDTAQSQAYMAQAFEMSDPRFKSNVAGLHNAAGYIDQQNGDLDEARKHYEQAIGIDPKGVTARNARKYLAKLTA